MALPILCIAGPTASGKSARAVAEALARGGEVISVDSRQVYRGLDIGTEKITKEEMRGVSSTNGLVLDIPHHLIDIRDAREPYGAGDFVADATRLIEEIAERGKLPILAGGTHFYFDALLHGLPEDAPPNPALRAELAGLRSEELFARVRAADPRRAAELDPANRRRLIRALEIIAKHGSVPPRTSKPPAPISCPIGHEIGGAGDGGEAEDGPPYLVEWVVIDPPAKELRARIDARLEAALARGLLEEVARVQGEVGDARLNELGLEYRMVGEYLRGERTHDSLLPALSAKLWQYARHQKAWLKKLALTAGATPRLCKS